jgi:putative phosphoesterase
VQVAPVAAIRGNVDTQPWARALPATEVVEIAGISIYMLHNLAQLDLKPEAAGFRVVIYGHSHHPKMEEKNGVLYFNPGSAGPQRFRLPVSVGKLTIAAGKVQAELVELST